MKRLLPFIATVTLVACASLPDTGDGIVALEIRLADTAKNLVIGDSLTLHARALNQAGDSVEALVRWRTPDTLLVSLDSVSGVVVALASSGAARIQAHTGTLYSNPVLITLHPVPVEPGGIRRP